MTPENKIKRAIMQNAMNSGFRLDEWNHPWDTDEQVKASWNVFIDSNSSEYYDGMEDFRNCGVETGLPTEYSRHYESESVATQMDDGSWVGWTFWHGGGKHGEPEAIEWMNEAYDLDCVEEQKLVTVRTFKVKGQTNG